MKGKSLCRLVAVLLIGALLLSACGISLGPHTAHLIVGSGTQTTETREVSSFSSVKLVGSGHLVIEVGGSEALTIIADDNLLPYLTSDLSSGTLVLGVRENTSIVTTSGLTYRLKARALSGIQVEGGARVEADGVNTDAFKTTVSGAGDVKVSGRAARQDVTFTGGGVYRGEDLASEDGTVTCTGAGSITVQVSQKLDVKIEGACVVEYIGNPQVTKQVSGVGTIRQR